MLCYKKVSSLTWCLFVRYCECFQEQQFCDGCNCSNCGNIVGNEKARQEAINAIVQRNPLAFQPKIENGPSTHNVRKVPSSTVVHMSHILEKFIPVWRQIIFLPIISETEIGALWIGALGD